MLLSGEVLPFGLGLISNREKGRVGYCSTSFLEERCQVFNANNLFRTALGMG